MTDPRTRPEFASPQNVKIAKALTSKFPEPTPADKVRPSKPMTAPLKAGKSGFACVCLWPASKDRIPLVISCHLFL